VGFEGFQTLLKFMILSPKTTTLGCFKGPKGPKMTLFKGFLAENQKKNRQKSRYTAD